MGNPYAPTRKSSSKATKPKETETKTEEVKSPPVPTTETQSSTTDKVETNTTLTESANPVEEKKEIVVPETTMEGVLDWVGEDKDRAEAAIKFEKAQPKPRKTLISKLEAL